ncbi:hypothetical protein M408DRAFT_232771 [Serendipita vermifera MAFF 305830]|uniref:Uncharacterized protein n=1 Tax=Serendipita vermifera MAFF 305830 TaxID=933852 RepID=A0A0C3AZ87_SERVB|nr:hypothetical protein M408DRAFT_232771 [Serendipita vermifera MAFF 305830]
MGLIQKRADFVAEPFGGWCWCWCWRCRVWLLLRWFVSGRNFVPRLNDVPRNMHNGWIVIVFVVFERCLIRLPVCVSACALNILNASSASCLWRRRTTWTYPDASSTIGIQYCERKGSASVWTGPWRSAATRWRSSSECDAGIVWGARCCFPARQMVQMGSGRALLLMSRSLTSSSRMMASRPW